MQFITYKLLVMMIKRDGLKLLKQYLKALNFVTNLILFCLYYITSLQVKCT